MAEQTSWQPGFLPVVVAFFSWLAGPLLVPVLVGVSGASDLPAGLLLAGVFAVWWSGCLALLTRYIATGRTTRTRRWRGSWLSAVVARLVWWLVVGVIWLVTSSVVALTVARLRLPTRDGGTPIDAGDDGAALVSAAQTLGWVAFGLALVAPVLAWVTAPRGGAVSDPPPPAGP